MTDILTRLREAPEGSRELDRLVYAELVRLVPDYRGPTLDNPQHYTTSIDAALPWENITAMGWFEVVPGEALGEVCEAWHEDRESGLRTMGAGKTEALARRIAALKARMAKEDAA